MVLENLLGDKYVLSTVNARGVVDRYSRVVILETLLGVLLRNTWQQGDLHMKKTLMAALLGCLLTFGQTANADVSFHFFDGLFDSEIAMTDFVSKGTEGFENNTLAAAGKAGAVLLPLGTLESGVPLVNAGQGFTSGLAATNISLSTLGNDINTGWTLNYDPATGSNLGLGDGIRIDVTGAPKTAIGFSVSDTLGGPDPLVSVFDTNGNLLSSQVVSPLNFLGVIATNGNTIGSVVIGGADDLNIFSIDDIQLFEGRPSQIPEPTTATLLALGLCGLAARRRR